MTISTAVVRLVAMIRLAVVISLALYMKGNVKAGGTIGPAQFFIEASDKQKE